ncbi:YesL family protein [Gracilibacillus kekensis]|uniref:Uncharacterized membrane protein YesL n=1 Tax=Gracilibacillus kekensis TaxID=1027249 RepID=A0A1M7JZ10_9BACI|nr:DUF624 domain-containing protein [Gracilibacillus kekensis]SHM58269.1 Uncharacterized membrane protein YesL [Gracilibacillus kekensis]
MSKTYVFADWILEMLKLHAFWMLYTLKGGIILGIFPSTAAAYGVIRTWKMEGNVISVGNHFKKFHKENFKASNILGWLLTVSTAAAVLNFSMIPHFNEITRLIMYTVVICVAVIVVIEWLYLFPILVHYSLSIANYFVVNMRVGLTSFSAIIMQFLIIGIYGLLIYIAPALFLVFGIIPIAFVQIAISNNVLNKMQVS